MLHQSNGNIYKLQACQKSESHWLKAGFTKKYESQNRRPRTSPPNKNTSEAFDWWTTLASTPSKFCYFCFCWKRSQVRWKIRGCHVRFSGRCRGRRRGGYLWWFQRPCRRSAPRRPAHGERPERTPSPGCPWEGRRGQLHSRHTGLAFLPAKTSFCRLLV